MHDTPALADADLPLVQRRAPWPFRVLLVAFGVFALVMPTWELGRGLWPINIATPVFAAIILGAAMVGIHLVAAGMSGGGDVWTYPPGTILIRQHAWGKESTLRLTATNIAAVEVREWADTDDNGAPWQVVVVPKPTFSGLATRAGRGGVFDAGHYGSREYAERIRHALQHHVGLQ